MIKQSLLSVLLILLKSITVRSFISLDQREFGTTNALFSRSRILTQLQATKSFAGTNLETLLSKNREKVEALGKAFPEVPEITRLRFVLAFPSDAEARRALRTSVVYRRGAEGRSIVDAAAKAVELATASGGWDNEVVRAAAPFAASINQFISAKNIITLSADNGDLVYVIRASLIDDRKLMDKVTVEQMGKFFLYVKEVHSIVANARSLKTGRLSEVIFANDISGVRAIPDRRFSKALTESSQQYEKLYPSLAGPTMILNLPFVLQTFIGLIKPLFPKSVQDRIKFKKAPVLASLEELTPLSDSNDSSRKAFLDEIDKLLR